MKIPHLTGGGEIAAKISVAQPYAPASCLPSMTACPPSTDVKDCSSGGDGGIAGEILGDLPHEPSFQLPSSTSSILAARSGSKQSCSDGTRTGSLSSALLYSGRQVPLQAAHALTGLVHGVIPRGRMFRGRCVVRGADPHLWCLAAEALGYQVVSMSWSNPDYARLNAA